jgi:homoserine O-acetyltransferase
MSARSMLSLLSAAAFSAALGAQAPAAAPAVGHEGDYVATDFHFKSGEVLPKMTLHYTTFGAPRRDAKGVVNNAVMILHGTTGTGKQFTGAQFAGVLYGPGQLLDTSRYYIILPDGIGHGKSSKPSDGMHAKFPHYDYDDMVAAQHLLLTEGLKVDHLRLILGTSMGCMHAWTWGETYPDFTDALMPLACNVVQIAGRNRVLREMAIEAIMQDPAWKGGDYTGPVPGMKTAIDMLMIMGSAPLYWQKQYPTHAAADSFYNAYVAARINTLDPNDFLYAFQASRNYDPSPNLEKVRVPVMHVNSADDFINPPELGLMEVMIKRVPKGKFVLLPVSDATRGHGTHTLPAIWKSYLEELLKTSQP